MTLQNTTLLNAPTTHCNEGWSTDDTVRRSTTLVGFFPLLCCLTKPENLVSAKPCRCQSTGQSEPSCHLPHCRAAAYSAISHPALMALSCLDLSEPCLLLALSLDRLLLGLLDCGAFSVIIGSLALLALSSRLARSVSVRCWRLSLARRGLRRGLGRSSWGSFASIFEFALCLLAYLLEVLAAERQRNDSIARETARTYRTDSAVKGAPPIFSATWSHLGRLGEVSSMMMRSSWRSVVSVHGDAGILTADGDEASHVSVPVALLKALSIHTFVKCVDTGWSIFTSWGGCSKIEGRY